MGISPERTCGRNIARQLKQFNRIGGAEYGAWIYHAWKYIHAGGDNDARDDNSADDTTKYDAGFYAKHAKHNTQHRTEHDAKQYDSGLNAGKHPLDRKSEWNAAK